MPRECAERTDSFPGGVADKHDAIATNPDVFDARGGSASVHDLAAFEQQVEGLHHKPGVSGALEQAGSAREEQDEERPKHKGFAHTMVPLFAPRGSRQEL